MGGDQRKLAESGCAEGLAGKLQIRPRVDDTATASLVTSALGMAIGNRQPDTETVIHSDQGTPFTSWRSQTGPASPASFPQ